MSYTALALKYRPNNFEQLLGQEVLVGTLSNAIFENRVHHAFLLTGIRGIGKTTTARIIAKNLNCIGADGLGGATPQPCEVCVNCVSIKAGNHPDVIEFDAASNTGIDDVKVIISNTHYAPILARKKVFIIDEVHMLSTKAFNALLKTLEEPPENIIFIFATTEVKKVPITILSRCQKFFLKALGVPQLQIHLHEVAKKEGFALEEKASEIIATKAFGSVRDALSLLDMALLSSKNGVLTEDIVRKMLNIPSENEILSLFEFMMNGKTEEALEVFKNLTSLGLSEEEILNDLLYLVSKKIKLEASGAEKIYGIGMMMRFYQILAKGIMELKLFEDKFVGSEILLIKLMFASALPTTEEVVERLKSGELNDVLNQFNANLI